MKCGQHQEHVTNLEADHGYGEEIDGDQLLGMILEYGAPTLRRRCTAAHHLNVGVLLRARATKPRARDRSRQGEACGQGSNVPGVEADGGEQESLLAERSEVGNNLGDKKWSQHLGGKGYTSLLCKYNDFNTYGFFGTDDATLPIVGEPQNDSDCGTRRTRAGRFSLGYSAPGP